MRADWIKKSLKTVAWQPKKIAFPSRDSLPKENRFYFAWFFDGNRWNLLQSGRKMMIYLAFWVARSLVFINHFHSLFQNCLLLDF